MHLDLKPPRVPDSTSFWRLLAVLSTRFHGAARLATHMARRGHRHRVPAGDGVAPLAQLRAALRNSTVRPTTGSSGSRFDRSAKSGCQYPAHVQVKAPPRL
jgi:hypothetical protein